MLTQEWLHENAKRFSMNPRTFTANFPTQAQELIRLTSFLPETCKMTERMYCYLNGINSIQPDKTFKDFTNGYIPKKVDMSPLYLEYAAKTGNDGDVERGRRIHEFIRINKLRNANLYELSEDEQNSKFIVCPVTDERVVMIKSTYITSVLGMTVEDFTSRFPDTPRECSSRSENIKKGVNEIDQSTGKSKHQLSVEKSVVSRNTVGDDGLTVNQRKGAKTRETHMNDVDENGLNGYQRLAKRRNETVLENGLTIQQNALVKKKQTTIALGKSLNISKASNRSKKVLAPIIEYLENENIKYYFDATEYAVSRGTVTYCYDLVAPSINMCVEYQSKEFHPSIHLTNDEWMAWRSPFDQNTTADTKIAYDFKKAKTLYIERGIPTWFVWEHTQDDDVDTIMIYLRSLV